MDSRFSLTEAEKAILQGAGGETLRKVYSSIVRYGEVFGAQKLITLDGPVHLVTSFGIPFLSPTFDIIDELLDAHLIPAEKFTVNPRPMDFKNVPCTLPEKLAFHLLYRKQESYEAQLQSLGIQNSDAYTCSCFLQEVGNTPQFGEILAWSESSAVTYANSVIGARTNRNAAMIELLSGVAGKTPLFGFLTDEGRRADCIIDIRCSRRPEAQLLGSAIGRFMMDQVPFIRGLDVFFPDGLDADCRDYLKDLGAAAGVNGALGLFHVENLTPEAVNYGSELVKKGAPLSVIEDDDLKGLYHGFPVLWSAPAAQAHMAFVGCPHLSQEQLQEWLDAILHRLEQEQYESCLIPVVLTVPPAIEKSIPSHDRSLWALKGIHISSICPLLYMSNPLCARKRIITNSNKLRGYSTARYYSDWDLLNQIVGGQSA
ncbi:MAG: aconitase X catalytic domain-containing protein [Spirochaetales bacterium]|nr:aconitase X catalytic domain-containing protein [Spirochaetales bacterium]